MSGPNLASVAWRNLWRQKRRTFVTLFSIAFGGFMAVLMTAMQDYTWADFIDTAARLGSGHVTIQHEEYLDSPTFSRTVTETAAKRLVATADQDVGVAVERTSGMTMLSTASDSFGAVFIAYDPEKEDSSTFALADGLEEGEMFKTADDKGIILGHKLAKNLGAKIGDKVVYTVTDSEGEIVAAMGRLRGTIKTGAPSLDSGLCLLPLNVVRETLGYGDDEATQVAVFLSDSRRSLEVRDRLDGNMGAGTHVLTWDQIQPEIRSFIAMKVGGALVMIIFIALIVAAGIFNTIFVSVMERFREFGIMLAIGYTPGQLFRMILWESLWLSLVGLVLCVVITVGPYFYLANTGIDISAVYAAGDQALEIAGVGFDTTIHVGIFPNHAIYIGIAIVVATMLAGLYPAWKAGRIEPVETIRIV